MREAERRFLEWLGQQAIDGLMECGNREEAERLKAAFLAGWTANQAANVRELLAKATSGPWWTGWMRITDGADYPNATTLCQIEYEELAALFRNFADCQQSHSGEPAWTPYHYSGHAHSKPSSKVEPDAGTDAEHEGPGHQPVSDRHGDGDG